jgi:L-threonylcarbamoyladenylate synthase
MLSIAQSVELIAAGELVAFPTETVYGLGANACNDAAVAKIFTAKGRPADHPLIVHVANAAVAQHFAAELPSFAKKLMQAFWPGPLTVIVPRQASVANASAGGQHSIGLRCPSHPVAQELLHSCTQRSIYGLAAPSANKFGKVSPTTAAHVHAEFGGSVPVLDGGACEVGIESTIIDCTRGAAVLLRPGVLTIAEIEKALGGPLLLQSSAQTHQQIQGLNAHLGVLSSTEAPKASGTLESHYAPAAPVRIMNAKALQTALDLLGTEAKNIAVYARSALHCKSSAVLLRRMPQDAKATAQQLFAVLREFDAQAVKLIWVEEVPANPEWDGVRDRLTRAAA